MPAALAAIALMLVALPARAEDRVPVPAACKQLAEQAGIPLTLTHAEAARAVAYIRIMVSQDPAVARCRLALRNY
jgi:predicted secreted protein